MPATDPRSLIVHAVDLTRGREEWADGPEALRRIRRGSYLASDAWDAMYVGQRHLALVHATAAKMTRRPHPVFSFHAAAALWGLPILGVWPEHIDVTVRSDAGGSSALVRRHHVRGVPPADYVSGLPVTSVARTVVDLARCTPFASALVTADAALRGGKCGMAQLAAEVAALSPRAIGRRMATRVVHLADLRSGSEGESLSRARMFEMGFPQPELQVPLLQGDRRRAYGDFGWGDLIGEFDGRVKYRADGYSGGAVEEVVWREKVREDAIRRTHRVVRWVWEDALDPARLRRILVGAGLEPMPGRPWMSHPDGVPVR